MGTDTVMTLDVNNLAAFQNALRCRTEHLEANMLFVEHFVPVLKDSEVVVVSPDAGGVKRAERLRQLLSHALGKPVEQPSRRNTAALALSPAIWWSGMSRERM